MITFPTLVVVSEFLSPFVAVETPIPAAVAWLLR